MSNDVAPNLTQRFAVGWNQFWFTPSSPTVVSMLRVLAGLSALYWLATFTPDLVRFFGAGGLLPIDVQRAFRGDSWWRQSFLDGLRTANELHIAHAVGLAVLAMFTLGLFTRVNAVLSLFVVLSYIHRGPQLTSPLEAILAPLLFYLCFAPAGACCSVDVWWRRRRACAPAGSAPSTPSAHPNDTGNTPRGCVAATISTRLIQIHVALLCLMMGLAKLNDAWPANEPGVLSHVWWGGDAVWHLAARPSSPLIDLTGPLGSNVVLTNAWTLEIVFFELAFAVLAWVRPLRGAVLVWAGIHWGLLALISGLAPFCMTMLAASLAFAPSQWVESCIQRCPLRPGPK